MKSLQKSFARCTLLLGSLALLGLAAPGARAWNGTGHMTVADIAYDNLTPKTRAAIDALLARHRDYALWVSQMPAGYTDRARFAFMKAATWPDDIRKTPDDRPIWHYIDIPVVAPGYTPTPAALVIVQPNAETQIGAETTLLTTASASDQDRAVALCWVEHLIGDIHQPLHDASFFSTAFPKGDKGGNSESLASGAVDSDPQEASAHPHRLHALWDDLLGAALDPAAVQKIAAGLETSAYGRASFPQLAAHKAVHDWVLEGSVLAQQSVYAPLTLPSAASTGPVEVSLPVGYLDAAHKVADRQVALAGLRLADTLNAQTMPPLSAASTPAAAAASSLSALVAGLKPMSLMAAPPNKVVGNKRTHVYTLVDHGLLPAEKDRMYFQTESDAKAAGYHSAGPAVPAAGGG